jgi:hypothetical protein
MINPKTLSDPEDRLLKLDHTTWLRRESLWDILLSPVYTMLVLFLIGFNGTSLKPPHPAASIQLLLRLFFFSTSLLHQS